MLESLFHKPLELTVGDRTLRFTSKGDLEFALASRTEVPAVKIAELVHLDSKQLMEEAASVRQVERHFMEILSRSIQDPASIGYLLREMDMKMFSQDHDWRSIMQSLSRQHTRFDDYKQLALVKYTQYLASRQDVLKGIFNYKPRRGVGEAELDPGMDPPFRETLIIDVESLPDDPALGAARQSAGDASDASTPTRLMRLPRGESVRLCPAAGSSVELVLSRHSFQIRTGQPPILVDDAGGEHPLGNGRNRIGRHPDSDIMVDAAYRDVSRTHLILELDDDHGLRITDLSSHGTFVPSELLGGAPDA